MLRRVLLLLVLGFFTFALGVPASAARPILDPHKLDAYFALFARDSNLPWQPATVRLDTYSDAPVSFAVYEVDPAAVIVAGANTQPRAIDTHRNKALATWQFTPPGGYHFQSNEVGVPLGSREGFFVVEARRGNVGEQVWINRTRIGLITKESSGGILVYAADLRTGRALAHARVSFVVSSRFAERVTDGSGIVRWRGAPRPVFALAQSGGSVAFVSFLPQPPLPQTIVGVKVDSAVVHAGDDVRVVGFVRTRSGTSVRASSGEVNLSVRSRGTAVAQTSAVLDGAGAFTATLHVPPGVPADDYTVLATANGATAGTALHVDANAGGLSLQLVPQCASTCAPGNDVPVVVRATRDGVAAANVPVGVSVVRSPHVFIGNEPMGTAWGITAWCRASLQTGADGTASFSIPHPSDGLASTYGVRAESNGATAGTRVVVPTAPIALRLQLEHDQVSAGTPLVFDVYANDVVTGTFVGSLAVRVQLVHGASIAEQTVTLDASGHAHGSFSAPPVGSNLMLAKASASGADAMDAQQVQIVPQALAAEQSTSGDVSIALDRASYASGDDVHVDASAPGAQGDALLTFESAAAVQTQIVPASSGHAAGTFKAANAPGVLGVGAAFVRDGALLWSGAPVTLDAPGRPAPGTIVLDKAAYAPGATALLDAGPHSGTLVVRVTQGQPSGSALFETAPDLLAIGATTAQDTAPAVPSWHAWVDSTGEHAASPGFARRGVPPQNVTLSGAQSVDLYWKVSRYTGTQVQIPVPAAPGTYTISILAIGDDGRVSAASSTLVVR